VVAHGPPDALLDAASYLSDLVEDLLPDPDHLGNGFVPSRVHVPPLHAGQGCSTARVEG
jgi:hypothetical protein